MAPNQDNKVLFVDMELGSSDASGTHKCDASGEDSSSRDASIVGSLPSDMVQDSSFNKARSESSSAASVNSFGIDATGTISGRSSRDNSRDKKSMKVIFPGASILKKRNNAASSVSANKSITTARTGTTTKQTSSTASTSLTQLFNLHNGTPRKVWYSRWLFLALLCAVASVLGYLTYDALSSNEAYLAEQMFDKVAVHAIDAISTNQKNKKMGMDSLSSVIASVGAEAEQWPYVTVADYESIANDLIDVSKGCNIAFGPILTPEQVPDFEAYAEDFYQVSRGPEPFPNGTGVKVEDRVAVWAMDKEMMPFHDYTGETAWNSSRLILAPMYQHSAGPISKLMFNMHASPLLGKMIDDLLTCAEETRELILEYERKYAGDEEAPPSPRSLKDCTMVTEIQHDVKSITQGEPNGPGANIMQPVYPAYNKTQMTGVLVSRIVWTENMNDVFTENVNGIDIVMSTPTQTVSFTVEHGEVVYKGTGDLHDPCYDEFKQEGNVTLPALFAPQSTHYTIALYPNDDLMAMYSTNNPFYATIGAICVMFFTVLMFMGYDFLVQREFNAKHELLKAKRHFMRYVSHEVRTPLNSVCMGLNLMQEEISAKLTNSGNRSGQDSLITIDEAEAWLSLSRDVHISAQSATNVLNDFLNYDKIESRQLTLELSTVTIQPLVNEIVTEFVLPAQDKKISLAVLTEKINPSNTVARNKANDSHTIDLEKQLLQDQVVVGDKARLSQVCRNVISNAIKFTPEGGSIDVKLKWIVASVAESTNINLQDGKVETLNQTGWIQIEITDSGAGMTKEQLATVFESGVQFNVNKHQKGGGSGLGLFIARGIVDQHNGSLTVESEGLGHGTTFVCKLPLYCKPHLHMIGHIPVSKDESITERVTSSWLDEHDDKDLCYRILVVDDAPMNRKLLTRLLLKRGHTVDMAEDGLEALEMVLAQKKKGKRYDTILMDFQMPRMDGPTAAAEIRKEGCDSFIVGITGNVLKEDVEHFKSCGADGVLGKPFQVEELESMWIEYGVTAD